MIGIRFALWLIGFLGALWAIIGLFTALHDFGVGIAVAAASILGWGLCDWLEDR